MTWHTLVTFGQSNLKGDLNVQNPLLKFGHFWNTNSIQRTVFSSWKGFLSVSQESEAGL